ncbi:hypothetical protein Pst134EB_010157 [Puccinia striiformis f. sp. tritici]|nr:hypothetical protein Pst134EB_010157 [Puccinia striiformis f. sp. tritici]
MNRGFSNHTSLTSNASIDLNALEDLKNSSIHASRLTSGCSMPSSSGSGTRRYWALRVVHLGPEQPIHAPWLKRASSNLNWSSHHIPPPALASRRKVPLAEIIGRPLDPSPSISSLQSHLDGFRKNPMRSIHHLQLEALLEHSLQARLRPETNYVTIQSQSMKEQNKHQKNSPENDHHEESNFFRHEHILF